MQNYYIVTQRFTNGLVTCNTFSGYNEDVVT